MMHEPLPTPAQVQAYLAEVQLWKEFYGPFIAKFREAQPELVATWPAWMKEPPPKPWWITDDGLDEYRDKYGKRKKGGI